MIQPHSNTYRAYLHRLRGRLSVVALALGLAACSTTGTTDSKPATSKTTKGPVSPEDAARIAAEKAKRTKLAADAKQTVRQALAALQLKDETAFRGLLSTTRKQSYKRDYFILWVGEVARAYRFDVGTVRWGSDERHAKVKVSFTVGQHRESAYVRVVREQDGWRWDEG